MDDSKVVSTAISINPTLLSTAKQVAKDDGRSFSNYVNQLIKRDLHVAKKPASRTTKVAAL